MSDTYRARPEAQGTGVIKGEQAGKSFAGGAEIAAKKKADAYRVARRKSFAWKPPAKPGMDPDWDTFDPDKMAPSPVAKQGLTNIKAKK